ncbi:hypothetical protein [Streptomyces sp. H51]|uniref:hypothetical protein n=1 Tax=Streptomyces sp. H51 TaxID=3111770 RepID=UPI002D788A3E|nr:hypothetical protein [Streptomyces sp. H51]
MSVSSSNGSQQGDPNAEAGLFSVRTAVVCLGALLLGAVAGGLALTSGHTWPEAVMSAGGTAGLAVVALHQLVGRR